MTSENYCPGIGRLAYFGCTLAMFAGAFLIGFTNPGHYWEYPPTAFLILASIPLALAVTALRLINIGERAWLALATLIPFMNRGSHLYQELQSKHFLTLH